MLVVIFRAKIRAVDDDYARFAQRMRDLALSEFGCLAFHAVAEGNDEIAISFWPDEKSILAWKAHPEHVRAQEIGKSRWYEAYSVHVAEVQREYRKRA